MLVSEVPYLRDFWYPLGFVEDLETGPMARRLLNTNLVIWSPEPGQLRAAPDRCIHRDAPLSAGWQEHGCLVCPYHGWAYDDTGRTVRIPQNDPQLPIPTKAKLNLVHAQARYGVIWICLGNPVRPIPDIPHHDEPGIRWIRQWDEVWAASATRVQDNGLDPAHVPWVHRGTFGAPDRSRFKLRVRRHAGGLQLERTLQVANPPDAHAVSGSKAVATTRRYFSRYFAPFFGWTDITYPEGLRHTICLGATPVDDTHVRMVQWALRTDRDVDSPLAELNAFDRRILDEDKALLEHIDPDYPLDFGGHTTVKLDRATVEYRAILKEICSGQWHPVG